MWNEFSNQAPAGRLRFTSREWVGRARTCRRWLRPWCPSSQFSLQKEISVVTTTAGSTTVKKVPFTDQDQGIIDDFLDEYLVAAGFEPRPRGYDWYLRLPNGITSFELSLVLNAALAEENAGGHPAQVRPVFDRVLANLYTY